MSTDLLLQLPHRQFVWTVPKCLRVYLKHDRELHADLSRLIFSLLSDYFSEAAGREIKLLGWKHSGFSIESNTRIYSEKARESLCQYIVRAPISLEKLYWDSDTDTVLWHGPKKGYFRGEARYFSGLDFIARVTLHIPPKGKHPVRRYGVYSSRTRGTWKKRPALSLRAAEGWYGREAADPPLEADAGEEVTVPAKARRKAWERLLAKAYEIDVLKCPQCGGRMSVIAVVRDPESIRAIVSCLEKKGRGPP